MILYALACDAGHRFESWFRDSAAFDQQTERGLLACPVCHSGSVAKTIMAPAVVGGRGAPRNTPEPTGPAEAPDPASGDAALLDDKSRELRASVRSMRDKIIAEGHDVGRAFAAEARRIHDGEAPTRHIYGQASIAEARDLLEDGIMVLPMPAPPEGLN